MEKENTSIRLKRLMTQRDLKQIDILNACIPFCEKYHVKMNKSDLSQYVSGKVEPNQDKLFILGNALNVSEAWLMGYDVPMEREGSRITHLDTKHQEAYNIDDTNLICLISNYKELSIEYRNRLVSYSQKLLDLYKDEEMLKDEPISEILKNVPKTPEELEQKYPPVDVEGLRTKKNIG